MTRSDAIQELLREYADQRKQNEQRRAQREREVAARDPEIIRLREDSVQLVMDTMKLILSDAGASAKESAAREMEKRGSADSLRIRQRLKALGLEEDYLDDQYRCPLCRDTAYVGEAPARFCECFETRLRQKLHEDGSMANTAEQNFDTFDLERFPQENDQRRVMKNTRKRCEAYADSLPNTETLNILLTGAGGLGKTFLLNCVYERAVSRGISAVRIEAFRAFEAMRRQHFSGENINNDFTSLLDVELLLIDDLGTEPLMRNITVEYLFLLLSERMTSGRHTFIATNLSSKQLQERYGDRVYSRLFDMRATAAIELTGKDLRRL